MPTSRELARGLLSIAVTILLLAWALTRADPDALLGRTAELRPGWLLAAALLGPVQVGLAAERWRVACGRLGQPLARGRAAREVALSTFLAQVLPGGVAGDALRAWRARTGTVALPAAIRAVVVDRWIGLAVHLVAVGLGLAVVPASAEVTGAVALLAVALGALPLLPAGLPGLGPLAADLRRALGAPGPAAAQLGLSAALTASFLLAFALCGRAIGLSLPPGALGALPLVLLAMAVPLSVGGWGLREAAAAVVLPRVGVPEDAAVALSATYGASVLLGALPGAFVPVVRR